MNGKSRTIDNIIIEDKFGQKLSGNFRALSHNNFIAMKNSVYLVNYPLPYIKEE